jgi:hypothetical protein
VSDNRLRPVCIKGHDISLVGRNKNHECKGCSKERKKMERSQPGYREYRKQYYQRNKASFAEAAKVQRIKHRFQYSVREAKQRGIPFEISETVYYALLKNDCFYCSGKIGAIGVGLDRIRNDESYCVLNVVPCCARCNWMKSNLTLREWLTRMKTIVNRLEIVL